MISFGKMLEKRVGEDDGLQSNKCPRKDKEMAE